MKEVTNKNSENYLIVVDWGTTNFRAYLVDGHGQCIESVNNDNGVLQCQGKFADVLMNNIGHWLKSKQLSTIVLSGMVGSKVGWIETPYVDCPAKITTYGRHCLQIQTFNEGRCYLVPGVKFISQHNLIDVMRGEELQVIGAYLKQEESHKNALFCCPGTHSKWVEMNHGCIDKIKTAMTGEMFSLLTKYSLLSNSVVNPLESAQALNTNAFEAGLKLSKTDNGLLNHIFSVRTCDLFGQFSPSESYAYLSGILIGHEIKGMIDLSTNAANTPVKIIGSSTLSKAYSQALNYFNVPNTCVSAQASIICGASALLKTIKETR